MKSPYSKLIWLAFAGSAILLLPGCSSSKMSSGMGGVLLALLVALVAAKLGGELFVRLGQPAVLGELILGIVVGNLSLAGVHALEFVRHDPSLEILAQIGIILLLFQVGLESDFRKMRQVGLSSLAAAVLGVVASFALGWAVAALLLPGSGIYRQVFVGVVIASSSIGIAGRVFLDLGRLQTPEARVVLGAAVIDDMIGLIGLTIVTAIVIGAGTGEPVGWLSIGAVVVGAIAFPVGAVLLGSRLVPAVMRVAAHMKASDLLLTASLGLCFGFSYLAHVVGLAPIIGAFAAGLMLEEVHWRGFVERGEHSVKELMSPLVGFLAPIFFFVTGARVDLSVFGDSQVWALAIALAVAAILGKQFCGLGVFQRGVSKLSVGIGMIPRGEVVLIAAALGSKLIIEGKPIVSSTVYSAAVFVVVITTIITPPLLKWSLSRRQKEEPS